MPTQTPQLTSKIYPLRDMLPQGIRFALPLFQREYTWKPQQCAELWADIQAMGDSHYMGAVTLQELSSGNAPKYEIIDGQQRLVSLSLMALACAQRLEGMGANEERRRNRNNANIIRSEFLVNGDNPESADNLKLQLSPNDAVFFRALFNRIPPDPKGVTQKNISRAFDFFRRRFQGSEEANPFDLMRRRAGERLLFARIVIPSEHDAPRVFASLNARGLPLTSAHLVKCHLMVTAPRAQVKKCAERWSAMNNAVGEGAMGKFLCDAYNAENSPATTESDLPDKVRKLVDNEDKVISYLEDLRGKCDLFCALQNPTEKQWTDPADLRRVQFFKTYGVNTIYPVLMSAKERIPSEFSRILRIFEVVTFRRIRVGLGASPVKVASQEFARQIAKGEIRSATDLREKIMNKPELCPSDRVFRERMDAKPFTWPDKRPAPERLRYVLARLEIHMSDGATGSGIRARECVRILSAEDLSQRGEQVVLASSLGNFALWENEKEDTFASKSVGEKIEALRESRYRLSRDTGNTSDFAPEDMRIRHARMVDCAVETWKL